MPPNLQPPPHLSFRAQRSAAEESRNQKPPHSPTLQLTLPSATVTFPHCRDSLPLIPFPYQTMFDSISPFAPTQNLICVPSFFRNESPRLKRIISGTNSFRFEFPNESPSRLMLLKRMLRLPFDSRSHSSPGPSHLPKLHPSIQYPATIEAATTKLP